MEVSQTSKVTIIEADAQMDICPCGGKGHYKRAFTNDSLMLSILMRARDLCNQSENDECVLF